MVLTDRFFGKTGLFLWWGKPKGLKEMRSFMQRLTQGELETNTGFVLESENPEICYGGNWSKRAKVIKKNNFRIFKV